MRNEASRRVEYLMARCGRDGDDCALQWLLDQFSLPPGGRICLLDLVNELVARVGWEQNLIAQSEEEGSETAGRRRSRPYELRPPSGRAGEDPGEEEPEPLSAKPSTETQEQHTIDIPRNPNRCNVCDEKEIDSMYYPCGHRFACFECAHGCLDVIRKEPWFLTDFDIPCPVCRQKVKDIVRTYAV